MLRLFRQVMGRINGNEVERKEEKRRGERRGEKNPPNVLYRHG